MAGSDYSSTGRDPILKREERKPEDYEMTKGVLIANKQFRILDPKNLKIEVLKDNTELMSVALEDMRLTREEEKRKLNER